MGGAAELARPDQQGAVQQAPLLQVGDQSGDGLVDLGGAAHVELIVLGMAVPAALVELNETDSPLHHPARQQAHSPELGRVLGIQPVQLPNVLRFAGDVDQLGGCRLHAEGQLVVGQAGGQARVVLPPLVQVPLVPAAHLVQDLSLVAGIDGGRQVP